MTNNLYVGIDSIMNVIAQRYKSVNLARSQVMEWSAYAQINELGVAKDFFFFQDVPLVLEDDSNTKYKKAKMPCNIFRLLDVYDDNAVRVPYNTDGIYFYFKDPPTKVFIKYYGVPVTEEGRPLFIDGHEVALAYYCLYNYYEELYMLQRIDGQRFSFIEQKWYDEREKARSILRRKDRGDIERMLQIISNMVPKVGYVPVYTLD